MKKLIMGLLLSMILVLGAVGFAACDTANPSLTIAATDKKVTLKIGETKELTATKVDIDEAIIWSSSDASVATVNATTGSVEAVSRGTATITAAAGGKSDTAVITVITPSLAIAAADKTATLVVGNKKTLTVNKIDIDTAVVWSSTDATVATVNASTGEITALAKGTTVIAATAGTIKDTAVITVIAPKLNIAAADKTVSLAIGDKKTLTATKVDINAATVWSTSNADIATVNANTGEVTAVAVGTATITATAGTITDTAEITVYTPISIDPATFSLNAGEKQTLVATLTNIAETVVWSSSNPDIATVNAATGEVEGIAKGTATITATAGTYTATSTVSVLDAAADRVAILKLVAQGLPQDKEEDNITVEKYYINGLNEKLADAGNEYDAPTYDMILDFFRFISGDTHDFTIIEFENALADELAAYVAYFNDFAADFIAEFDEYSDSIKINSPSAIISNKVAVSPMDTAEELYGENELAIIAELNQTYQELIADLLPIMSFDRLSNFDSAEYYRITGAIRALSASIDLPTVFDIVFTFTFDFGDAELNINAVIAFLAVELAYQNLDEAFLTDYFANGVPLEWTVYYKYAGIDTVEGISMPGFMVNKSTDYYILSTLIQGLATGKLLFTDPAKSISAFENEEGNQYMYPQIPQALFEVEDLEELGAALKIDKEEGSEYEPENFDYGTGSGYAFPTMFAIVFKSTTPYFIAIFA